MTEITRVPLQPLAKGSKSKLWLGAIIAIALGGGVAAAVRPPLVDVQTLKAGSGGNPTPADVVLINYVGRLSNGTVFDQQKNVPMMMQGMIPGFVKALQQTQAGGKYLVHIPARMAYGDHAAGPIPANSDLTFEIEVLQFANRAMLEQQQRMMEQMMRQQQGGHEAGPDGAAPAPTAP
ncbi:MAG: FKBP-type peptidyl-prolyl cis-trans isomerase [Sphingomonadales bacterium]|nr:FKBP-type peptidyl-prolyl cis-trans isomerase [Sphingomonadales bacterium]MDE2168281.1 FKBP-type peptidyl-prolyl cis-trans isomerase [Sphingomonadales bacterium]